MTDTTRDKKLIDTIKRIYYDQNKITLCHDSVITYYRAYDDPYTWHIHNALSFMFHYDSQVLHGIAYNGQTKIKLYLNAILRTINHIVFDGTSESKYQSQMYNHLKTFLNLANISALSGIASDAIELITKKCVELYSPIDPPVVDKGNPLNLLDVENIKDSFAMEIYESDIWSKSTNAQIVIEIKSTNRSTKDVTTIKLVFHM